MSYHNTKRRLMYPLGDDAATFDFSAMNPAVNPEATPTNPGSVTSWGAITAGGAAGGAAAGAGTPAKAMPTWVMPIVIIGGGALLVTMLRRNR